MSQTETTIFRKILIQVSSLTLRPRIILFTIGLTIGAKIENVFFPLDTPVVVGLVTD